LDKHLAAAVDDAAAVSSQEVSMPSTIMYAKPELLPDGPSVASGIPGTTPRAMLSSARMYSVQQPRSSVG
jgi:hypothetical protein